MRGAIRCKGCRTPAPEVPDNKKWVVFYAHQHLGIGFCLEAIVAKEMRPVSQNPI